MNILNSLQPYEYTCIVKNGSGDEVRPDYSTMDLRVIASWVHRHEDIRQEEKEM